MSEGLELLAAIGIEPATVVDVGASDGRWSRQARSAFPAAEFVLFEPQPAHRAALESFRNEDGGATIIPCAAGGRTGSSPFLAPNLFGGALQESETADSITVPVVTLDETLAAATPPFLVKLDTHGAEAAILAGAQLTLSRSIAWIIEAYNYRFAPDSFLFWELCARMVELGFRPVDLRGVLHRPHDETLWQMDLFFIRASWDGFESLSYT
ncbi:MAG: FkbM family methyltransferase [Gaiellaceae bacterium]